MRRRRYQGEPSHRGGHPMGRRRCQVIEKEVTLWEEEDAKESQVIEKEVTLLLQWRNPGPCFGAKVKFNS